MNPDRKYLVIDDYDSLSLIKCDNEEDQEIKKIIKEYGRLHFTKSNVMITKTRIYLLKLFIEKYKNQLNQNQLDSLNLVIKNVTSSCPF
jgi:hypothetical protein